MPLTFNAIFLGNSPIELDPIEGNNVAENASLFVGQTFGAPGDALAGNWVSFTSVDLGGSNVALDMNNNVSNDQAIIDDGSGPVTYTFDGTAVFTGFITYIDGSTSATGLPFVLVQMTNGDLYLVPSPTDPTPTNTALTSQAIRSIEFTGLVGDTYLGMGIDRPVLAFVNCYAAGSRILTPGGARRIETLEVGDLVLTADAGAQPIRWIGRRAVSPREMMLHPGLWPVTIAPGTFGNGLPQRQLVVSQQHRMMVRSRITERICNAPEALVAAKHLVGLPGIVSVPRSEGIEYWHLLLDRHAVVFAEGLGAETLFTGPMALKGLSAEARDEIIATCPALSQAQPGQTPARPLLNGRQARNLVRRHRLHELELFAAQDVEPFQHTATASRRFG